MPSLGWDFIGILRWGCYIIDRVVLLTHLNFGGDLDSTGVLRSKLHARDAVGPLKNGKYIIANDYDVAVAA